jgi:hypothetical protein
MAENGESEGAAATGDTAAGETQGFMAAKIGALQVAIARNLARAHIASPSA